MDGVLIFKIILAVAIMQAILLIVAYLILLERRTAAWMQDRLGPNRVGPQGLLQPIADGIKFILKEEFIPKNADKALFLLAPIWILTTALLGFSVIPFGGTLSANAKISETIFSIPIPFLGGYSFGQNVPFMVSNPDVGILIVLAVAGLSTYGVVLGGWASGSKYSFLGGLRATAQMLSYEVPLAISLMTVLIVIGSLSLTKAVEAQAGYFNTGGFEIIPQWNIFIHPIAFLIFTTCVFAEANRASFDLSECEAELVGGYHTEYSSMKFAMFFLAEYAAMITGASVMVSLFLGGWHLPWIDKLIYGHAQLAEGGWLDCFLKFGVFWAKVVVFCFFYMWIRWTLPRFRFDQLMHLAWRGMIPLALAALLLTATIVFLHHSGHITHELRWILVGNVALFAATLVVLAKRPKPVINKRVPVVGSRYNPQFTTQAPPAAIEA